MRTDTRTDTAFTVVDAFTTERPFSGNPAGVVMLDEYPDEAWMQGVADELHQTETAFRHTAALTGAHPAGGCVVLLAGPSAASRRVAARGGEG